jgi:hypothetical protein
VGGDKCVIFGKKPRFFVTQKSGAKMAFESDKK